MDDPNYDPATTAAAESPSKPIAPEVQAALDAALVRIEALEKQVAAHLGVTTDPPPTTTSG